MSDLPLLALLELFAEGVKVVDRSGEPYRSSKPPFREYQLGVGPYSESQLAKRIVARLQSTNSVLCDGICTKREPDILIPGKWAIEMKIARPFGDNGKEAEHWSQNLLHPYPGNVSSIADALKLRRWQGPERRAVIVIGYEHVPAKIDLGPLVKSFELLAQQVTGTCFGDRAAQTIDDLVHPIHQRARLWAWEILP